MTIETTRLRVNLTITKQLEQALKEKAQALKVNRRDAIHLALVDWAYAYEPSLQVNPTTDLTMLKEAA
jgi:hypothetical protein